MTGAEIITKSNRLESDEERLNRLKNEEEAEKKKAEIAKHSPFKKFIQLNDSMYKEEAWLMRKSAVAYQVLRFLTHNMDNYNALICSYKVFEEALGYSTATITRAIRLLKEHRYIEVAKSGTTNIYFINKNLYWKSYGTNYKFAEFGAKIIITATEQDKAMQAEIEKIKTPTLQIGGDDNDVYEGAEVTSENSKSILLSDFAPPSGGQNSWDGIEKPETDC